jgi:hypothetical protein
LEQHGHETCTAVTGEQAMEILVGATPATLVIIFVTYVAC